MTQMVISHMRVILSALLGAYTIAGKIMKMLLNH